MQKTKKHKFNFDIPTSTEYYEGISEPTFKESVSSGNSLKRQRKSVQSQSPSLNCLEMVASWIEGMENENARTKKTKIQFQYPKFNSV